MRYAGVDEVGNGCLAGPITAVAVALDVDMPFSRLCHWHPLPQVRDSKKTTPTQRGRILPELMGYLIDQHASIGVCDVPVTVINEMGHTYALELAKREAVLQLLSDGPVGLLIVDGSMGIGPLPMRYRVIPKADDTYWIVSAASIIAKCHRDAYMHMIAREHPQYGWDKNLGYAGGAKAVSTHVAALRKYGLTRYHRHKACRTVLS